MHKRQRKQYVTIAYFTGYTANNSPEVCDFPIYKRANFLLPVWEFLNVLLEQLTA